EELADVGEDADVGGRVAPRGTTDRRLVDVDHLVEVGQALHLAVLPGTILGVVEVLGQAPVEDVVDQRALAAATDPGDAGEGGQSELDVDRLEVVGLGAAHGQGPAVAAAAGAGHRDLPLPAQELRRDAVGTGQNLVEGARGNHPAAVLPRPRAYVDDEI